MPPGWDGGPTNMRRAFLTMGLLKPDDSKAKWITACDMG